MDSVGEINGRDVEKSKSSEREDLTDVYISVYFDGTSNNMYASANKRNKIRKSDNEEEDWANQTRQASQPHRISEDPSTPGSNATDKYSNVAILYSLSKDYSTSNDDSEDSVTAIGYSIYVEGSGAKPYKDGDPIGAGFGVGDTGVTALVSKAIRLIYDFLSTNISSNIKKNVKLHFAIFGFSRGSTCARVLANLITRGKNEKLPREGEFEQYLKRSGLYNDKVCFLSCFSEEKITVDFLGIYDTVSAIGFLQKDDNLTDYGFNHFTLHNPKNKKCKEKNNVSSHNVGLSSDIHSSMDEGKNDSATYVNQLHDLFPKYFGDAIDNFHRDNVKDYGLYSPSNPKVKNTFHICALDEFRENFALVNLGKSLNGNCAELFIPGCHSDIGGGYMEDDLLIEYNLRTSIYCDIEKTGKKSYIPTKLIVGCPGFKPKSMRDLEDISEEGLIKSGWYKKQEFGFIENISSRIKGKHNSISSDINILGPNLIKFKRYVKEGYSNISLEAMKNRAMSAEFGLGNWPKRFQPFDQNSRHIRFKVPEIPIAGRILKEAATMKGKRSWIVPETIEEYRNLRSEYIHFTSTDKRYAGLLGNPLKIPERTKAIGVNLGNPPNWKLLNIGGSDVFVLCRLMYNGDPDDRKLNILFDLKA